MPKWIEGTIRFRGSKENIKKFVTEGLELPGRIVKGDKKTEINYEEDGYIEICISYASNEKDSKNEYPRKMYIPHTRRNFVEGDMGDICIHKNKNRDDFTLVLEFQGAWSIDTDGLTAAAKEYEIDIRVNGYERGMEFEQLFEVNRHGSVRCDSVIQYEDYEWECPMPLLGG